MNDRQHNYTEIGIVQPPDDIVTRLREQNEYLKSNIEMLLREARYASSE